MQRSHHPEVGFTIFTKHMRKPRHEQRCDHEDGATRRAWRGRRLRQLLPDAVLANGAATGQAPASPCRPRDSIKSLSESLVLLSLLLLQPHPPTGTPGQASCLLLQRLPRGQRHSHSAPAPAVPSLPASPPPRTSTRGQLAWHQACVLASRTEP